MMNFNIPTDETPEMAAERKRQAVASALMSPQQLPQNVGQGIQAMGQAIMMRQKKQNAAFPTAPGGGQASFATNFANLFSGGNNGGMY